MVGCDCTPKVYVERKYLLGVQAERDMLVTRMIAVENHDSDLVGASSSAMLIAALTGRPVARKPLDVYDLNRCERTYERAPAHLKRRMLPTLKAFREVVFAYNAKWHLEVIDKEYRPAQDPATATP